MFAPNAEHARAVADGGRATVAASAEEAVRGADVVVTATSSREPVVRREWFVPGAHVNAVGASVPSARELDLDTVVACALFCDSRESLRDEAGEYRQAVEQGAIDGDDHVRASLGEVLAGMAPGRTGRRRADRVPLARPGRRGPGRGRAGGRRAAGAGDRDGGGTVIELRRDRGRPGADRRRGAAHAARPAARRRGPGGHRDLPEARGAPADRVVQDPRRDQRRAHRARRGAPRGAGHRERRQHGSGRRLGRTRARPVGDDRRPRPRPAGQARRDRAPRRAGRQAPLRRLVAGDRDQPRRRASTGCSSTRSRTRR